jgi:hypothetical protein
VLQDTDTFDEDSGAALRRRFEAMVTDWEALTTHTLFGHPS